MAGMTSKNNPDKRVKSVTKMVTSDICEKCSNKCSKGINYLEHIKKKGEGKGVSCLR